MERASNGGADGPTAYLDSVVIMALSDPDDMHHEDAVRTCSAAVNLGRCRLVASLLAAMEAVGSVRKKVTTSHKPRPGSEAARARVDEDADRAAALMLDRMGYMDAQGLLKIVSPKGWSPCLALLHGRVLVHAGRAARTAGGRNYGYRGSGRATGCTLRWPWRFVRPQSARPARRSRALRATTVSSGEYEYRWRAAR